MNFVIQWIIYYIAIISAMSIDNIFWISSSPPKEYNQFKLVPWISWERKKYIIGKGLYYSKLGYIFKYRILSVWTDKRDIIPAIITSLVLTLLL